jgi:hypothetical protein
VSVGVSPADRVRAEIDALFAADRDLVEVLEDVARLGARLIIQTAVEAEVTEFLGRARYQRAATPKTPARVPATATARPRSRPPPDRSPSTGRSCAAPPNASRRDASAPG